MREIKFRAVTIEGNIIEKVGKIEFFINALPLVNKEIPAKELLEWTGLQDKNGKEIFEGDIVNLIPPGYVNDGAVVVWSDDEGCWIYRRIYNDTGVYAYKWRDVEVIGDIYSNPELLEEKVNAGYNY